MPAALFCFVYGGKNVTGVRRLGGCEPVPCITQTRSLADSCRQPHTIVLTGVRDTDDADVQ